MDEAYYWLGKSKELQISEDSVLKINSRHWLFKAYKIVFLSLSDYQEFESIH